MLYISFSKHFVFSVLPILYELVVECTYPIDQASSHSLIDFSSRIQIAVLMAVENLFCRPLTEAEMEKQTCSEKDDTSHELGKDYLPYSIFITVYATAFIVLYLIFFRPEMKRSNTDKLVLKKDKEVILISATATPESEILVNNDVKQD